MRIPLVVSLAPLALAIACSDEGPIQNVGPKLTISPATVSVETGADAITLQAVPQNGTLTGSVAWAVLSGNAGTLGTSSGITNTFTPSDLGTAGGNVVIKATGTVAGAAQAGSAAVQVVPSAHGRIALGIDPGGTGGASVSITDPGSGQVRTFVAAAPSVQRSPIIDAGTYVVTADAGISVPGTLVDGIWDGTVSFDGGTPARSAQVPVKPNLESTVVVQFALRGGLGRLWVPASGAIAGYTETELLVDHATETGVGVGGARAVAFDADGNLWATFSDGVKMFSAGTLASGGTTPTTSVTLANATGIAIRGDTVAVGTCSGSSGGVSTFSRSAASPSPTATPIAVGCVWGLSYDVGNNGKLWVASRSQGKIYRFTTGFTSDFSAPSVSDAYGVAVDSSGNAWVSSCSGNSVQEVSPTGTLVGGPIATTDFSCPGGLAFDKQGNLWVLSSGTGTNAVGNLVQISGASGQVQLNSLAQVTFGGIAFDPGAVGLPTRQ